MKPPELPGGVLPEIESGGATPSSRDRKGPGRDETPAQAALRLVIMMLGSAGLAADRSLFWTILSSYAKKDAKGDNGPPSITHLN